MGYKLKKIMKFADKYIKLYNACMVCAVVMQVIQSFRAINFAGNEGHPLTVWGCGHRGVFRGRHGGACGKREIHVRQGDDGGGKDGERGKGCRICRRVCEAA